MNTSDLPDALNLFTYLFVLKYVFEWVLVCEIKEEFSSSFFGQHIMKLLILLSNPLQTLVVMTKGLRAHLQQAQNKINKGKLSPVV